MFSFRRHRRVPELNTTSTADISFMLLTFFLVTTSMDVDKGLVRQLPPMDDEQRLDDVEVDKRRVMDFRITADSRVVLGDKQVDVRGLRPQLTRFLCEQGARHIINIDADPQASYEAYFALENEIVAAYAEWRDRTARSHFGRPFKSLNEAQREQIRDLCPQHVAETYATAEKGGRP